MQDSPPEKPSGSAASPQDPTKLPEKHPEVPSASQRRLLLAALATLAHREGAADTIPRSQDDASRSLLYYLENEQEGSGSVDAFYDGGEPLHLAQTRGDCSSCGSCGSCYTPPSRGPTSTSTSRRTTYTPNTHTPNRRGASATGCFVATVAFDGEGAPEVIQLRRFRDQVLARSKLGRYIINLYAFAGPHMAKACVTRPRLLALVRLGLRVMIRLATACKVPGFDQSRR
jgi:hypothetical protein